MRHVNGLTIIVASPDPVRFRSALTLAAAHAALGGRTRMLLDGDAVALATTPDDLLESCFELGVSIILCQSGLAATGFGAATLDPRYAYGGMVGLLADLGADRLIMA